MEGPRCIESMELAFPTPPWTARAPPTRLHRPDNNRSLKAKVMYDSLYWTR